MSGETETTGAGRCLHRSWGRGHPTPLLVREQAWLQLCPTALPPPPAAVEAQVQQCGEDQDHRQHIHGSSRAQRPLRA